MKSGNLNFLEPSGPLQACNGTALTLRFLLEWLDDERIDGADRQKAWEKCSEKRKDIW
jgi:hypothetical protein